jgi:hypothetical protein
VVQAFDDEASIRVPRGEDLRRNEFALWLSGLREMLRAALTAAVAQELVGTPPGSEIRTRLAERVWAAAAEEFRQWAVRGMAAGWTSRNLVIGSLLGVPERIAGGWRVPLGVPGYGPDLGQVTLDEDGNVLNELTTSRDELRRLIDASAGTAAPTAAR